MLKGTDLPTVQLDETLILASRNIEGCIVVTLVWRNHEIVERTVGAPGECELVVVSRALADLRGQIEPAKDKEPR